ncbi:CYTH domain-containing protein [Clostridium botulinum]|uniref:CYTH domain-containing protein n=1 Tax=Clostridium botulinum TaxID=1491 RepID=A0A6B4JHF9_CLOBO|nr:CYTH domain-containing protein [Clostridium botulinum]EES50286.1 adenylate cyclase [Clostridium botulinum E1 str. 'BoNT E Beluga']MBY6759606.1 CYTH domain-containing protein [Clostridium botulinum]MBY6918514.1 CYTH domain-containing protein [Clostridium botulinum]MCR1129598.1 CYTH domain-containing protein [Clostridium botulinum]NFH68001.1 CYTH domain-containing protein [Clostridium botulinum]
MQEIETRIMDIDIDNIRKLLIDNGAENIKKEDQINDIYDFEDGKLLSNKGYARIRTVTDNINNKVAYYMTTKKMLSQERFKVMEENEVIVNDKKMAEGIFKSLGLKLKESNKKYRESYRIFDSLVEIDINEKKFCPFPYLEIETTSEGNLDKVVKLLGYTLEDTTSQTIYDILAERGFTPNSPKGI